MVSKVEKETWSGDRQFDSLVKIGIDESSHKKGYKYITVVINHDTNAMVWEAKASVRRCLKASSKD